MRFVDGKIESRISKEKPGILIWLSFVFSGHARRLFRWPLAFSCRF